MEQTSEWIQRWIDWGVDRASKPAIIDDFQSLSWQEFVTRSQLLAGALAPPAADPPAGASVALYLNNGPAALEGWFGAILAGYSPLHVPTRYKAEQLASLLIEAQTQVLIFHASYAMRVWEIRDLLPASMQYLQVDDNTEVLLEFARDYERALREATPHSNPVPSLEQLQQFSAGVRGPARRCEVELAGLLAHLDAISAQLPEVDAPRTVLGCPLTSLAGAWYGALLTLDAGGTLITTTRPFNADHLCALVREHRADRLLLAGEPHLRPLLRALRFAARRGDAYELNSLNTILSSGVAIREPTIRGVFEQLPQVRIVDCWTAVEGAVGLRCAQSAHAHEAFDVWPNVAMDETGQVLTPGWSQDAPSPVAVGDLGASSESRITWLGRTQERFELPQGTVFADTLEAVLQDHPDVADNMALPFPVPGSDDDIDTLATLSGTVALVALVDEDDELDLDSLIARFAQVPHLPAPERVLRVHSIKRGANGKPDFAWALAHARRFA